MINACAGMAGARPSTFNERLAASVANQFDLGVVQSYKDPLPTDCNLYIQWGYQLTPCLGQAVARGVPFVILDRPYWLSKQPAFSISINGLHGLSMMVPEVFELAARPHPRPEPRREPGEFVYVYSQRVGDRDTRNANMETWPVRTAQDASAALKRPAKVRAHPLDRRYGAQPSLASTFDDTFCAVAWTAPALVQAALAGVTTLALHPANPAWPVSAHSYDELDRPRLMTRKNWLHQLSHMQYGVLEFDKAAEYIRLAYPTAAQISTTHQYDLTGIRK